MKKAIISAAKQKRLDRYAVIKKEYINLISEGGDKTAVIDHLCVSHKASSATIYRAIKEG